MNTSTRAFLFAALAAWLCTSGLAGAQTVVWSENFDDGNGNSRWYADNGVWQIGSPTIGPGRNSLGFRSRSGADCATTGLSEDYLSYQDSRLIRIASFVVPPANQSPRLRFWQWFSFAGQYYDEGSYGWVEVRSGTGAWTTISPTYTSTGSGVWSQPSIDLSAYAGQSLQIAFHFHSASQTSTGWYLDDIALITGTPIFNNPEGFEAGMGDWSAESGTWEVGQPSSGPGSAHSGTNCAATVLAGSYAAYSDSRFISPPFMVPAASSFPRLRFWQWFSFAGQYYDEGSYGWVEVRSGAGAWTQVSPTYTSTGSGVWSQPSIDLSAYAGQSLQIAFHFHSASQTSTGWYLDDIALVTGAPVFNNPEGFEAGMGDWSAESGTWQVGRPSSGPGSAHSGTNCAATVLAGNYAAYSDSRFISPPFTVPAANSFPRIRFWQWFSFAGQYYDEGSSGWVELKSGTNAWTTVSPTYTSTGSGVWSQPSIDLSAYAGQSVQIAFHFHSASQTSTGWYLDDVALVTGAPVFDNPEGFEAGMGDWSAESGTWQVGKPSSGPGSAHSGTNCAATVLAADYAAYSDSRFVSPPFTVPAASSSPGLRFWHWFSFAGQYYDEGSYGWIEVRSGTNAWKSLSSNYSGNSGAWTQPYFDLSPYAGQSLQVAFHFHSASQVSTGWYVDDVQIQTDVIAAIPSEVTVQSVPWTYAPTITGTGYTFSLVDAPPGMTVDPVGGLISWDPTAAQAPALYTNIVLDVSQAGGGLAPIDSASFSVRVQAVPAITWSKPSDITYGTRLGSTQLNASANVPGTPLYIPAIGTILNAGLNQVLTVVFTPTDTINYIATTNTVFLNVVQAPLTITANNDTKTYGQAKAYGLGSTSFTSKGLQNGETIGSVALASTGAAATASVAGSPYSILPSAATGGAFNPSNYSISYQPGSLVVGPATLTITANNDTKTYGQTKAYGPGSTSFTSIGLQNGETIGSVTITASGGTATNAAAGTYSLVPSAATGGTFNPANYAITYLNGTLTVNQAALGAIIVVANPPSGGSVGGSGSYPVGAQQQIFATPNSGWAFTAWSNGTTNNPWTITVLAGTNTYTANFTEAVTHPADTNGAFRITINEVTAYGAAWKLGASWPIAPNPIPIDYVTQAGYLWKSGECYTYDSSNSPPLCWVSTPCASPGLVLDRGGTDTPPLSRAPLPKDTPDSLIMRSANRGVVSLQTSPRPEVGAYAVEEVLPVGLTPYAISDGGSWDSVNRKIKWGLFFDGTERLLSYKLGGIAGVYVLNGLGSFDGRSIAVVGVTSLALESSLQVVPDGVHSSGGRFRLTFPTESGRTYYIDYTDNLASRNWQEAGGPLAGTGQPAIWQDDGSRTGASSSQAGARYYRVRSAH